MVTSSYLYKVFDKAEFAAAFQKAVDFLVKFDEKHPFDTIVFRGQSGAAYGYPLGLALNKNITCIRKESDKSHNTEPVEGYIGGGKYIIVDDFISSGETMRAILSAMKNASPKAKCAGVYLHSDAWVPDYLVKSLGVKIINKHEGEEL